MNIRVRFAPSPTGYLHIGGVRTALFNYLFAKNQNGKFILRIEDTDSARSKKEYENNILAALKWLKLDWDEVYRQSERMQIYSDYAKKLADSGKTYKCFCTKEELDEKRKIFEKHKKAYKYDRKCESLKPEETAKLEKDGKPYVLRFKIPEGKTEINDLVRGKITFDNSELDDIVLVRADKIPTYNFCVVVDDALMEITHIIRGEDHISNTPRQILLYQALGFNLPEFAHIPLILGSNKARLSKREGAVAVTEYKESGYLPEAVNNFLALMGCSYNTDETILPMEKLIKNFSMKNINKSGAIFDIGKLDFLNGHYIRQKTDEEAAALVKPFLNRNNLNPAGDKLMQVIKLEKDRLKKLDDILSSKFFFTDKIEYDKDAVEKHLKNKGNIALIKEYAEELKTVKDFSAVAIEKLTRKFIEKNQLKLKDLVHPVRVALTGKLVSPGLFEVMEVLGKETCLKRLRNIPT